MPRILVTNDDGVHAEGIRILAESLTPLGDITIVAPIQEASAIGHALTLRRPIGQTPDNRVRTRPPGSRRRAAAARHRRHSAAGRWWRGYW